MVIAADVLKKERAQTPSIQLFSSSDWNFGSPDSPRDLDDYLDDFEHFDGLEPWLNGVSRIKWSNFFLVYPASEEPSRLSKRARELIIIYCLEIVEHYAARFKRTPTLSQIEELMTKDYQEEYSNAPFQFNLALRDKVIKQAVMTALANRFQPSSTLSISASPKRSSG
jgi:hypothetical protein